MEFHKYKFAKELALTVKMGLIMGALFAPAMEAR
jgi:hypothetical protein